MKISIDYFGIIASTPQTVRDVASDCLYDEGDDFGSAVVRRGLFEDAELGEYAVLGYDFNGYGQGRGAGDGEGEGGGAANGDGSGNGHGGFLFENERHQGNAADLFDDPFIISNLTIIDPEKSSNSEYGMGWGDGWGNGDGSGEDTRDLYGKFIL